VEFSLNKNDAGILELTIEDNGEGFDLDAVQLRADHQGGMGFPNMLERIELSMGCLQIESTIG